MCKTTENEIQNSPAIMLVDDEPLFLKSTARYFMRKGYTVLAEEDVNVAMQWIRSHAGNLVLIIVDYDMPTMNGIDFARSVRTCCPQIPILMLSGYPPETFSDDEHSAVTEILYKPVDLGVVDTYIHA